MTDKDLAREAAEKCVDETVYADECDGREETVRVFYDHIRSAFAGALEDAERGKYVAENPVSASVLLYDVVKKHGEKNRPHHVRAAIDAVREGGENMTDKDPARDAAERIASECGYCLTADAAEEILRHVFAGALEDTERITALEHMFYLVGGVVMFNHETREYSCNGGNSWHDTLRAAIDAVREGGEE
jgi:hypothetical protein